MENAEKALKDSGDYLAECSSCEEENEHADSGTVNEEEDAQMEKSGAKLAAEEAKLAHWGRKNKADNLVAHDSHASRPYEPEWAHNSGNSYNNGPTDHFYHGDASPYSVTKEDVQLDDRQRHAYEPGWGHNSGSSYDDGPSDHFVDGKASPYPANQSMLYGQDDVQLSANLDLDSKPLGSYLILQNQNLAQSSKRAAHPTLLAGSQARKPTLSLVQSGVEEYGLTDGLLQKNVNLYDIRGKVLSENKFKNSVTNAPAVDAMLEEDQGVELFAKEIGSHFGGLY